MMVLMIRGMVGFLENTARRHKRSGGSWPGKKEPEAPKESLEQPKGSVSEESGTAGIIPPGTKNGNPETAAMGIHPPNPRHVVLWLVTLMARDFYLKNPTLREPPTRPNWAL